MNQTLLDLLDKEEWKLGLAAWIFAGYSPLEKQRTGTIVRIADEQRFAFGSFEYREAEKAKQDIQGQLTQRVIDSTGLNEIRDTQRFDRNWLIDIAANSYGTLSPRNLDVWWLTKAVKEHYVPAYLCPKAISDSDRKARGSLSWRLPTKPDDIKDPKAYGTGGFGEGGFGTSTDLVKHVTPLFKKTTVVPNTDPDSSEGSKFELYPFFYEVIARQISVVPEKQAKIEGVEKHGSPLPTAAVARDLIIEAVTKRQKSESREDVNFNWAIEKAYFGDGMPGIEWYWIGVTTPNDFIPKKERRQTHVLKLSALNSRVIDWFKKTEAGIAYDEKLGINKKKYFG